MQTLSMYVCIAVVLFKKHVVCAYEKSKQLCVYRSLSAEFGIHSILLYIFCTQWIQSCVIHYCYSLGDTIMTIITTVALLWHTIICVGFNSMSSIAVLRLILQLFGLIFFIRSWCTGIPVINVICMTEWDTPLSNILVRPTNTHNRMSCLVLSTWIKNVVHACMTDGVVLQFVLWVTPLPPPQTHSC